MIEGVLAYDLASKKHVKGFNDDFVPQSNIYTPFQGINRAISVFPLIHL